MSKTFTATVVVAPREGGHAGWFQGGKLWASGQQYEDVELTQEELDGLVARPGVIVLVDGKPVKGQAAAPTPAAPAPAGLSSDERKELEALRAAKTASAISAKPSTPAPEPEAEVSTTPAQTVVQPKHEQKSKYGR